MFDVDLNTFLFVYNIFYYFGLPVIPPRVFNILE